MDTCTLPGASFSTLVVACLHCSLCKSIWLEAFHIYHSIHASDWTPDTYLCFSCASRRIPSLSP